MYGIRCLLCSQIASALAAAIFFSRFTPRHSLLVAMLGVARTRCAQTSCHLFPIITRLLAALKHHATCFQALLGCSLCLPTLPFRFQRRITFCNESLIAHFTAYNGNFKEKPTPSKSQTNSILFLEQVPEPNRTHPYIYNNSP